MVRYGGESWSGNPHSKWSRRLVSSWEYWDERDGWYLRLITWDPLHSLIPSWSCHVYGDKGCMTSLVPISLLSCSMVRSELCAPWITSRWPRFPWIKVGGFFIYFIFLIVFFTILPLIYLFIYKDLPVGRKHFITSSWFKWYYADLLLLTSKAK